jgi:ABC-type antimicrobial peptide transport system permease subunit
MENEHMEEVCTCTPDVCESCANREETEREYGIAILVVLCIALIGPMVGMIAGFIAGRKIK